MHTTLSWIRRNVELILKCIFGKTTGLDSLRNHKATNIVGKVLQLREVDYAMLCSGKILYCSKESKEIKKIASPLKQLTPVSEEEPTKKSKRIKRPAKKSTTMPTTGDEILLVPDESKAKPSDTSEGTGVKPRVPNVSKAASSDRERWGRMYKVVEIAESGNDDDDDYEEEEHDKEYVHSPENSESDDDQENMDEEEYDDRYKDVDMKSLSGRARKGSTQISSPVTEPATVIPDSSTIALTTVPPTISIISPLPQLATLTTASTTTSIPALPNFYSLFGFDQRVSTLEKEFTRIGYATRTALRSYTQEFEKKAQEERKLYIDVVEKSVKDIIKDESTITKSLENVFLAESFSQPKSTYEAEESLTEFELKKILLDKMQRSESYKTALKHKELYERLIKSYNLDKDLFSSYGKAYSLKRDHEGEDKDRDPPAGSNQRLKKRKTSKDVERQTGSKSKDSTSSSSKGTKPQPKSSGKSTQAEEPVFEAADTKMQHDQGSEFSHTVDQPDVEAAPKNDWFKKPERPPTPDRAWNDGNSIDFRPPPK
ncbi:hypothetical protein Tco_1174704 [Tanacetum coccineum]